MLCALKQCAIRLRSFSSSLAPGKTRTYCLSLFTMVQSTANSSLLGLRRLESWRHSIGDVRDDCSLCSLTIGSIGLQKTLLERSANTPRIWVQLRAEAHSVATTYDIHSPKQSDLQEDIDETNVCLYREPRPVDADDQGSSGRGQALAEQKVLGCSGAGRTSLDSQLCPSGARPALRQLVRNSEIQRGRSELSTRNRFTDCGAIDSNQTTATIWTDSVQCPFTKQSVQVPKLRLFCRLPSPF